MKVLGQAMTRARERVPPRLEALDLDAYLFEVESGDSDWLLRVECAAGGGWITSRRSAGRGQLRQAEQDASVRERLLRGWRETRSGCVRGDEPAAGEGR